MNTQYSAKFLRRINTIGTLAATNRDLAHFTFHFRNLRHGIQRTEHGCTTSVECLSRFLSWKRSSFIQHRLGEMSPLSNILLSTLEGSIACQQAKAAFVPQGITSLLLSLDVGRNTWTRFACDLWMNPTSEKIDNEWTFYMSSVGQQPTTRTQKCTFQLVRGLVGHIYICAQYTSDDTGLVTGRTFSDPKPRGRASPQKLQPRL